MRRWLIKLLSIGLSLRRHVHGPLLLWQILPLALRLLHCGLLLVLLLLREVLLRCVLLAVAGNMPAGAELLLRFVK